MPMPIHGLRSLAIIAIAPLLLPISLIDNVAADDSSGASTQGAPDTESSTARYQADVDHVSDDPADSVQSNVAPAQPSENPQSAASRRLHPSASLPAANPVPATYPQPARSNQQQFPTQFQGTQFQAAQFQAAQTQAVPPPLPRTRPQYAQSVTPIPQSNAPYDFQPPRYNSYVQPASAASRSGTRPHPFPSLNQQGSPSGKGLPSGTWTNDTPVGEVKLTITGNKISIQIEGSGEMASFNPSLRGEYSVASDGTIYGLIHNVDIDVPQDAANEMGEGALLLSGLSDIPFSMRTYTEPDVLAIKQVTFGLPIQVMIATDGGVAELSVYAQSVLTGQYHPTR